MSPRSPLFLAAGIVGVGCAVVYFSVRQAQEAPVQPVAAAPAFHPPEAPPAPPTTEVFATSAELRALLRLLAERLALGDVRPHEAVLSFKDEAALRAFLERARASGFTLLDRLDGLRSVRVRFERFADLQKDLIAHASEYSDADANAIIGIPQLPLREERDAVAQVPFGNDALAFIGADGDRSTWGRGVTIAILDTGVAADATFGSGRLASLDVGLGVTPGKGADDGHGTAVAALAAGAARDAGGTAAGANLLSIRVTDANGTSDLFTLSRAIVAATDAGAKVINVSLGGYSTSALLSSAIGYAQERGAVIVAAAGNDQAAQLAWPAADQRVVSVGAVDKAEQQVLFSNSGPQLQLTAPGYRVQTAWLDGRRVYVDGTSASAPLVSGAIATLLSQKPSLTPTEAAALLASTANDTGAPGTDSAYGHGVVNLATAMNRGNANYVDTAVSSHHYDAANGQMQFVVQNRSGRAVSGMSFAITAGTTTSTQSVPSLGAGETCVIAVPVNESALRSAGSLTFSTQLINPVGIMDQAPANNRRSSYLTAPGPR